MPYTLTKTQDIPKKQKFGLDLGVYPNTGDCGIVVAETENGHNEEFYNTRSTFNYIVLEGSGSFFLDDEEVVVEKGDFISIAPNTRIYYKGKMKLVLITNPAWRAEDEVESRASIW